MGTLGVWGHRRSVPHRERIRQVLNNTQYFTHWSYEIFVDDRRCIFMKVKTFYKKTPVTSVTGA
jgi:hypothetical protein